MTKEEKEIVQRALRDRSKKKTLIFKIMVTQEKNFFQCFKMLIF